MSNTLAYWWERIDTDSTAMKINAFLRNQSAIRSACKVSLPDGGTRWTDWPEFMAFLSRHAVLKTHGKPTEACTNYTLRELPGATQFEFLFSIVLSRKGFELVRSHSNACTQDGQWMALPN